MSVRKLHPNEQSWYERIRTNFLFPCGELLFALTPKGEGALTPCRAMNPVGEEVVLLSSEEFVVSSGHELTPPHRVSCVGELRSLGIGPKSGKAERAPRKNTVTVASAKKEKVDRPVVIPNVGSQKGTGRARQVSLDDYVILADSFEALDATGERKNKKVVSSTGAGSMSTGETPAGDTPTFVLLVESDVGLISIEL
ncbi:hypothetical protein Hanom_Chr15g01401761 [Helianthus anomalus]